MKGLKKIFVGALGLVMTLALGAGVASSNAAALDIVDCDGSWSECAQAGADATGGEDSNIGSLDSIVKTIINVVIWAVGLIAVFMIIFGGIQYSISAGDSGKVKKAKDTIMYGIIGLVISLLAYAIVNFVLTSLFSGSGA
jgi:hypothetical protein